MRSRLMFMIAVALMICSVAVIGRGSEKLYYGGFHVQALPDKFQEMKDSLRFNLVFGMNMRDYIDSLANASLQVVIDQPHDTTSPSYWSLAAHYTMWEAEGFPGSNYGLHFSGGGLVEDTSASGGQAMKWRVPETTQKIQWGPGYYQEPECDQEPIEYTAEFRLKFVSGLYQPPPIRGGSAPAPVCSIMVVDVAHDTVLKVMTLNKNHFSGGVYKSLYLTNYNVVSNNSIEFQIYLFGTTEAVYFYVDYVKVYDQAGYELVYQGAHDQEIINYVNQSWTTTRMASGDTFVIHRWYMKDEPGSIDCYAPYAYIDALLQDSTPYIPGAQWFNKFSDTNMLHDYLLRSNPVEYMIDIYPFRWDDSPSNYQTRLNGPITDYYEGKLTAESHDKDFWVAVQAHIRGRLKVSTCSDTFPAEYEYPPGSDSIWCCSYRDPTPNEIRLQTFLCMCYGADAVMYYKTPHTIVVRGDGTWLEAGLYDQLHHARTPKWDEVIGFTGPRVEKIGPIIADLAWQGACFHDTVGSFVLRNAQPSYIDSIVGVEPEST
jgi:hypothetical protein